MDYMPLHILLVDDDPNQLTAMGDILALKGFKILTAGTGASALTQVTEMEVDVAVIDLQLGDMSGLEVLREIKKISPEIEGILLTGHSSQGSAIEAINAGAYSYFQKPCDIEQLVLSIQRAGEKRDAQVALRESEARYRAVARLSSDFSYSCIHQGAAGYVVDWITDAFYELTGYSEEDLREHGCWMFVVHPDDCQLASGSLQKMRDKQTLSREFRILTRQGKQRWFYNRMECRRDDKAPGGLRLFGAVQNITERKEAESAVQESEEKYRLLFENAVVGVATSTPDGRLLSANNAYARMFGFGSPEEVVTKLKNVTPLYADPAERDEVIHILTENGIMEPRESSMVRRDGSRIVVLGGAREMRDVDGNLLCYQAEFVDITKRIQAEKELVDSEKKVQRLLNQQIAVNQLALALGESLVLKDIYRIIFQHIQKLMDPWCFIISSYDEKMKTIRAEFAMTEHELDVADFPAIPLAKAGKGTQSRVILSGQPFYAPDHQASVAKSKQRYTIEDDGSIHDELPSEKEKEDTTRSVVYLPMKVGGKTTGVMQVQSDRLDAFSKEDINLLAGMANVAAVAIQNSRLRQDLLHELEVRKLAEEQAKRQVNELGVLYENGLAVSRLA